MCCFFLRGADDARDIYFVRARRGWAVRGGLTGSGSTAKEESLGGGGRLSEGGPTREDDCPIGGGRAASAGGSSEFVIRISELRAARKRVSISSEHISIVDV